MLRLKLYMTLRVQHEPTPKSRTKFGNQQNNVYGG